MLLPQRVAPGARLLAVCGLFGALWIALAVAFSFPPALALGVCGLALGPVYPVTIALTGRRFPRAVGTTSGLVAGAGASGGFCMPWLSGAVGDASSATFAIAVLGASTLVDRDRGLRARPVARLTRALRLHAGFSTLPSGRRAKRPSSRACTGSLRSHGQPPNCVRR